MLQLAKLQLPVCMQNNMNMVKKVVHFAIFKHQSLKYIWYIQSFFLPNHSSLVLKELLSFNSEQNTKQKSKH